MGRFALGVAVESATGPGLVTAGLLIPDQPTIRQALRLSTAPAHDTLDRRLGRLDLADEESYVTFLLVQRRARAAIERWAEAFAPSALRPPPQTPLIDCDLEALGEAVPALPGIDFAAPANGALGVAWAIGGSSLGNRMMLGRLRKSAPERPAAFLADGAMPAFFARLRPRLDMLARNEADFQAQRTAAAAVFAEFARATEIAKPLEQAA